MKTRRLWTILVVGLVTLAVVLPYMLVPKLSAEAKPKNWVGSWNIEITVVNQNATWPGFLTFFSDGNVIADETPNPLETSGHGDWVRTEADRGAYTFDFLIGSTEPGQWIKGTVSGVVEYDAEVDQWSGPFTIILVDQDGNEVLSDTGTITGTRIKVESKKSIE